MRIISGIYKGRKLCSPVQNNIRPTSDRAKETLFNVLQNIMDFEGMKCLDLFCGSGALGLEMISRGAEICTFVDKNIITAEKNVDHLSAEDKCILVRSDALNYLYNLNEEFDIVFCDPPYDYESYDDLIKAVSRKSFFLTLEHSDDFVLNNEFSQFFLRKKKIGTVNFTLMDFNKSE